MTLILVAVNESEREEKEREGERKERTVCFAAGKKKRKLVRTDAICLLLASPFVQTVLAP